VLAIAWAVMAVMGAGCGSSPSDGPAEPASSTTLAGGQPQGFDTVRATITPPNGEECVLCLWLADTPELRARGLMGVTDLGLADGMAFTFDQPSSSRFYMYATPMPLSIAFYAADGQFVSAVDMDPCRERAGAACSLHSAAGDYVSAIEVPQGQLPAFAIGPGSRLELADGPGCQP
jgi:uncharacterized protein